MASNRSGKGECIALSPASFRTNRIQSVRRKGIWLREGLGWNWPQRCENCPVDCDLRRFLLFLCGFPTFDRGAIVGNSGVVESRKTLYFPDHLVVEHCLQFEVGHPR